jgi:hypothetical protein
MPLSKDEGRLWKASAKRLRDIIKDAERKN